MQRFPGSHLSKGAGRPDSVSVARGHDCCRSVQGGPLSVSPASGRKAFSEQPGASVDLRLPFPT